MSRAAVKTVQFVDPRIEPQPDPVYDYIIGPTQNQFYKIPASGKSNSSLTFNNLTTLGVDRAYLDTFEIELGVIITFNLKTLDANNKEIDFVETVGDPIEMGLPPDSWTFQSFPFNTCCDEARVNINGGAFFSQPMCYVRAKERYMDQKTLSKCYENVCPIHKPLCQTESGRRYNKEYTVEESMALNLGVRAITDPMDPTQQVFASGPAAPTRYGVGMYGFNQSSEGMDGGFNNSIVRLGAQKLNTDGDIVGWENMYRDGSKLIVKVKWREPLFVSPFSSRYDATYGRPLYNITSMDFSFNLMNLGNMIRLANIYNPVYAGYPYVGSYTIDIDTAQLCYQVMTIPATIHKPVTTLVPYRRFVPYITEIGQQSGGSGSSNNQKIPINGVENIEVLSGVYTLNEIPTAIWIFCAPAKEVYQTNEADTFGLQGNNVNARGNFDTNKLFGYIRKVNISLANTTQILNTAEPVDLYRIAKANGCEDSYLSWGVPDALYPKRTLVNVDAASDYQIPSKMYYGAGSVLRLKPGVDLIVPDIPLIPGANANNMVLQVRANFDIPPHSEAQSKYALWLLFEYVGVAAISPGQCEITMNPLGSGEIVAVSPVLSATSAATEGKLEGSGFWDGAKTVARIAGQLGDDGILSKILRRIPGAKKAAEWAEAHGLGEPSAKRGRCCGGAVMGHGLNDWV